MKNFFKTYRDYAWWSLCFTAVVVGVFVDAFYGFLITLLIGVFFYICLRLDNESFIDSGGVSFISTLIHIFLYGIICIIFSIFVETREVNTKEVLEVKYLENEQIMVSRNNKLDVLDDAKLYWECRAKDCTNVVITKTSFETVNSLFAKNLPHKITYKYSVE